MNLVQISRFGIFADTIYRLTMATKTIHDHRYRLLLQLLREARVTSGFSQIQVAERLGKVQSFVSDCENGERRIDVIEFMDLCEIYKLDACDLMSQLKEDKHE